MQEKTRRKDVLSTSGSVWGLEAARQLSIVVPRYRRRQVNEKLTTLIAVIDTFNSVLDLKSVFEGI